MTSFYSISFCHFNKNYTEWVTPLRFIKKTSFLPSIEENSRKLLPMGFEQKKDFIGGLNENCDIPKEVRIV
jgi:hypothetical protein